MTGLVHHSPDVYLAELQEVLEDRMGVDVHESTIWRSLKRCGFTMKKVTVMLFPCSRASSKFYLSS
jgi:transposase